MGKKYCNWINLFKKNNYILKEVIIVEYEVYGDEYLVINWKNGFGYYICDY